MAVNSHAELKTYQEACKDSHCVDAMRSEIKAMKENKMWIITCLLLRKRSIRCK